MNDFISFFLLFVLAIASFPLMLFFFFLFFVSRRF